MTKRQLAATGQFIASVKKLAKKYRHIKQDLNPTRQALMQGETPGDKLANVGCDAYKVRIKNSDNNKGKSGGYRLLYYIKTADNVVLLDLYTKSEMDTLSDKEVRDTIRQYLADP